MDGLGMKKAWNRNVRMMSARTNAIRTSPGTSPRNPRILCGRRFFGSGSSVAGRSTVFTGQGYRSAVRREPMTGSRKDEPDLDGLERRPRGAALAEAEPVDRAERDLRDHGRRARQPDAGAFAIDRDLRDASLHH